VGLDVISMGVVALIKQKFKPKKYEDEFLDQIDIDEELDADRISEGEYGFLAGFYGVV